MNPLSLVTLLDPVPADGDVKAGWGAAVLVVGLIVVTVLLWFSLRKQLGRIRFEEEPDGVDTPAAQDGQTVDEAAQPRPENGAGPAR